MGLPKRWRCSHGEIRGELEHRYELLADGDIIPYTTPVSIQKAENAAESDRRQDIKGEPLRQASHFHGTEGVRGVVAAQHVYHAVDLVDDGGFEVVDAFFRNTVFLPQ